VIKVADVIYKIKN